jgi:hypothetical protein
MFANNWMSEFDFRCSDRVFPYGMNAVRKEGIMRTATTAREVTKKYVLREYMRILCASPCKKTKDIVHKEITCPN